MNPLLEPIERALSDDATVETKQAGIVACRTILAALEAEPGKAIALPGVHPAPVSPLSGLSADQVFDVMIAKLRTMVDAKGGATAPTTNVGAPLRIPMIVLPPTK
jgi:hypothetical protein